MTQTGVAQLLPGGTGSVTVLASDVDYNLPNIPPGTMHSSASNTYFNATAGDTSTFQSWFNPSNTLGAQEVASPLVTLTSSAANPNSQSADAAPTPVTLTTPYGLTNQMVITLTGGVPVAAQDQYTGSTTITGGNLTQPANVYVGNDTADDFTITSDVGSAGLSDGDTVTWNPGGGQAQAGPVGGLIFGFNAFSSIQDGINAVNSGGTVNVEAGMYIEAITVNKSVTLLGAQSGVDARTRTAVPEAAIDDSSLSGGYGMLAIAVTASNVVMDGFTVQNSYNQNYDAGMRNSGQLTLANTIVSGNVSGWGGAGIFNETSATLMVNGSYFTGNKGPGGAIENLGNLTVNDSSFSGNDATIVSSVAGAIYNSPTGTASINSSNFFGRNVALLGGAIYNDGMLTINGSTLSGNVAVDGSGGGGAVYNSSTGTLIINASTFSGNSAQFGAGGIENLGVLALTNSTLTGNSSRYGSGAAIFNSGSVTVTDVTIAYNSSGGGSSSGGGLFNSGGTAALYNTIVDLNTDGNGAAADDIAGSALSSDSAYNLAGTDTTGSLAIDNHNQLNVSNPGLGALADNGGPTQTIALLAGSPAFDRGSNALVAADVTTDHAAPAIRGSWTVPWISGRSREPRAFSPTSILTVRATCSLSLTADRPTTLPSRSLARITTSATRARSTSS